MTAATTGSGNANLYALLEQRFAASGALPAFEHADGTTISYADFAANVARMANALESLGVRPGDRVMVQVEKSLANVELYLATLKVGAVYNPLNTAYTIAELDYFIGDAEPKLLVVPSEKLAKLEPIAAKAGVGRIATLEPDGTGSLADLQRQQSAAHTTAHRDGKDLAALLYTSGTTGRSKGAMITHENLSSNAKVLHGYWGFKPGDVLLHALPIFHVHGLFVALNTSFLNASKIIWLPKFDLEQVMRLLPRATVMMGVPTFYTRLLGHPAFGADHCRNMRLVISGSAPLLAETHIEFETRTGHKILERYGMTEAGMVTSNPYQGGERLAGTVGYALPGVSARVAALDGTREMPRGEVGVLEFKGPNVFSGYWRNPEKTREDFRADGYFISGDLSVMAPDGRITIVGRAKDLIISGGFNVYPKEVEEEINAIPGITESAVVGVPHPDFGEGVVAVVTVTGANAPTEKQILAHLADRLAKFKLPKRVFVVQELPRNAMGKVQKVELRKNFTELFKG
jgi:malonyl-CoA/methylmalonyl-CoA synthetase